MRTRERRRSADDPDHWDRARVRAGISRLSLGGSSWADLSSFSFSFIMRSIFSFLYYLIDRMKEKKENEDQHSRDQALICWHFFFFIFFMPTDAWSHSLVSKLLWILPIARLLFLSSVPGGKIPRVETNERECWEFLDWRLASENDSLVPGQPSFLKELLFQRLTG